MQTFQVILMFVGIVVLALFVLGLLHYFKQRFYYQKTASVQAKRNPLSDAEFCEKLSLNARDEAFVSEIRKGLAKRGSYDPVHIYPEDDLWTTFDFQLGDFLDEFAMKFIPCKYGELPYEELSSVGSFVKYLVAKHKTPETAK